MNIEKGKQTLFIAGCARSGTTALSRLLNHHKDVSIGIELFGNKFHNTPSDFKRDLFQSDQFFKHLENQNKTLENIQIVGDKFPSYYKNYNLIFDEFPEATVIFIFRNIFDVAQSYKARKLDMNNDWNKGVKRAVQEWNISLVNTLNFIENSKNIIPVPYELIMFKKNNKLRSHLNLQPCTNFAMKYISMVKTAKILDSKRINILNNQEKLWIMEHSDFSSYKELLSKTSRL